MSEQPNMAARYEREIPEGYEARIEGNKVIFEPKKSEDEMIRKKILAEYKDRLAIASIEYKNPLCNKEIVDFLEKAIAYLEKQKDASKAIEAIDKIDKYIDEHLANAHDMKDSNPDKKYYRGWDDALGEMAGILQDVYSDEKQKEQPKEELVYRLNGLMQDYVKEGKDEEEKKHRFKCYKLFWDALEDAEFFEQKEQKPEDQCVDVIKMSKLLAADRLASAEMTGRLKERKEILKNPEKYGLCQPAEWSEEDERNIKTLISVIEAHYADYDLVRDDYPINARGLVDWLKSLRPQPKQELSEEDKKKIERIRSIVNDCAFRNDALDVNGDYCDGDYAELDDFLKSFRSRPKSSDNWKPSEEQMKAMEEVRTIFHHHHLWDEINPILYDYEELMRDLLKLM